MPPHTNISDVSSEASSSYEDLTAFGGHTAAFNTVYRLFPSESFSTAPRARRPFVPGIYCPTPAFFDSATDKIDLEATRLHAVRLAEAGIAGIVTQGSNGEAVHLSQRERIVVTAATRTALDEAGYDNLPVLVGCGAQSTRETIELCQDAYHAGGDYAMVLPPSYYRTLYTGESQLEFFRDVADESPIPIVIYNFPGAVSGIDLDSDAITKLAKHPNIVGCKLTCGNTGKLCRVANATTSSGFMTMSGSCDFTVQSLAVGGKGVIGGLANIAPRACTEVYNLYVAGQTELAEKMQAVVARGDWVVIKGGVVATKSALNSYFSYGGYGRKPLPHPTPAQEADIKTEIEELILLEQFLERGKRQEDIAFDRKKDLPQLVDLERRLAVA